MYFSLKYWYFLIILIILGDRVTIPWFRGEPKTEYNLVSQ